MAEHYNIRGTDDTIRWIKHGLYSLHAMSVSSLRKNFKNVVSVRDHLLMYWKNRKVNSYMKAKYYQGKETIEAKELKEECKLFA